MSEREIAPRKGWPLSSLLLFGLSAVLAVLALLLWTGTIRLPAKTPPVTPGAIRSVDVIAALKANGAKAEEAPRMFVPRREFDQPGQGIMVNGTPMLLFIFPDTVAASEAFDGADLGNVLPSSLPGDLPVNPAEVMVVQGSNVVAALAGGDEKTRDIVKRTIEGLP